MITYNLCILVNMRQHEALRILNEWDRRGRYVFLKRDLRKILSERGVTFNATLNRLLKAGIVMRPAHGVYAYGLSAHIGDEGTLDLIARNLRRGELTYESLESALSQYGRISQIPVDRRTYMTTGRSGEYATPFGAIEFTHTKVKPSRIVRDLKTIEGRGLPVASEDLALGNLKDVHRNMWLVDKGESDNGEH